MKLHIKPLSSHSVKSDFISLYRRALEDEVVVSKNSKHRILYLRPSQLPFCPLSLFIQVSSLGMYRHLDMRGEYYTSVGTTVHEVMQNFLCRSGRYLADYTCRECGKRYPMSYTPHCCDFPTKYDEVTIDYKGVQGHIDAIFKDNKGKLWILDFKTTSIKSAKIKEKNPGIVYREQIEVYAVLVELQYGIKIEGIMDAFIVRDNPSTDPAVWVKPLTDDMRTEIKARLARYRKMHKLAINAETKTEALALLKYKGCKNPDCNICNKDDKAVKELLLKAYKKGKARGRLPIKTFVQNSK